MLRRNGPDLTDCEMMWRAIEGVHGGTVKLTVSPVGIGSTGGVSIGLSLTVPVIPSAEVPKVIEVVKRYPDSQGRDFWSAVFELGWLLDSAVGREYKQQTLAAE